MIRCGKPSCSVCSAGDSLRPGAGHGPYIYVRIHPPGERRTERSLGRAPSWRTFETRLADLLSAEQIHALYRTYRQTCAKEDDHARATDPTVV